MPLSQDQWNTVLTRLLGLRSGSAPLALGSPATYAMDCGVPIEGFPLPEKPENWEALLTGTIEKMQSFDNYRTRYLQIVEKSTGKGEEYQGCFPKSSVKPSIIVANTHLDQTVPQLAQWVMTTIP